MRSNLMVLVQVAGPDICGKCAMGWMLPRPMARSTRLRRPILPTIMSAHLANESAGTAQSAEGSRNSGIRIILNPVQHCVGEYGIKLPVEGQLGCVHHPGVKSTLDGSSNHVRRTVHADDLCGGCGKFLGQHTIAASEIENAICCQRIEQVENRLTQRGDKGSVRGVAGCIPNLRGHWTILVGPTYPKVISKYVSVLDQTKGILAIQYLRLMDSRASWCSSRGRMWACAENSDPVTLPRIVHGATLTCGLLRIRFVFPMSLRVIT